MRPVDPTKLTSQSDLFRNRLENIISLEHPLAKLGGVIDWDALEKEFGQFYIEVEDVGRPGIPIRVMAGLHYLKHLYNESDEKVVENPYWQYFCGRQYFEHELPCHPTALVKWRKRGGSKGIEKMFAETMMTAKRTKQLKPQEMERVNVDKEVQEKAIAFPTDAQLYHKARRALVRAAKKSEDKVKTELRTTRQANIGRAGAICCCRTDEASDQKDKEVKDDPGSCNTRCRAEM